MLGISVFVADVAKLASGVFKDQTLAKEWIKKHCLSGLLTEYPIDVCIYDWAVSERLLKPVYPSQVTHKFIYKFTNAYFMYNHFENGEERSRMKQG